MGEQEFNGDRAASSAAAEHERLAIGIEFTDAARKVVERHENSTKVAEGVLVGLANVEDERNCAFIDPLLEIFNMHERDVGHDGSSERRLYVRWSGLYWGFYERFFNERSPLIVEMEEIAACRGNATVFNSDDQVGAATPIRFLDIGLRVRGRMIGVRMIKPDDFQLKTTCITLYRNQLRWIDCVASVRRGVSVPAWNDLQHLAIISIARAEQDSATLQRIRICGVFPDRGSRIVIDFQHRC